MFVSLKLKTKNIKLVYFFFKFFFFKFNKHILVLKQFRKKKLKKFTVLKSPHVNKKSKESFDFCIFVIDILLFVFDLKFFIHVLNKLQNNIFLDLIIKIKLLNLIKIQKLNNFLIKKFINSKYLKILDIFGEIYLK
jgi:hypothetical protein